MLTSTGIQNSETRSSTYPQFPLSTQYAPSVCTINRGTQKEKVRSQQTHGKHLGHKTKFPA